eukprot:m.56697 g.56697  ORF g.56697 m.56697 type:complete len:221 (+) comp11056_c0_seq1:137-799(+)
MASKLEEMKAKMAALKKKREEAREKNHEAVVEEDRIAKLPANYEARRKKAEWEENEEKAKKAAADAGQDYERVKARNTTALEADRVALKKRKKKEQMDPGFSDYTAAQARQYNRLTKNLKVDMGAYKKSVAEWGDDEQAADSLAYGQHDHVSKTGIKRMVDDLEKQIEKRHKFSRRRRHLHDTDIDYINERNRVFNKKLDRFYTPYTQEIRDNLERGTAI